MKFVNHVVVFVTSPLAVSLALLVGGLALRTLAKGTAARRMARVLLVLGTLVLWVPSTGLVSNLLGLSLEREFPPQRVEEAPVADAIVVLGGGVGGNPTMCPYAELYPAADRVAHAARLWKAGKAPAVVLSGTNELHAARPFLLELGVPREAVVVENRSGNTEENARFVAGILSARGEGNRRKVLLVTSSWHMRRALLMFRRHAPDLDVVPAACDYEATVFSDEARTWRELLPSAEALVRSTCAIKEYLGYWGYRFLRR